MDRICLGSLMVMIPELSSTIFFIKSLAGISVGVYAYALTSPIFNDTVRAIACTWLHFCVYNAD